MSTVECYAQRLLNPFRGAMHTIRYASAEAATLDGVNWDIYVANDQLLAGLEVSRWTQVSDIRYGKWSAEAGLKRGPIYPSDDFLRMEEMGAMVYEYLTRVHRQIPFKFKDNYELWLLDESGNPLALLDSAVAENELELDQAIQWRSGIAAQERFISTTLQEGAASTGEKLAAADYLARYINAQAGASPSAQWFFRSTSGSGAGLQGIDMDKTHEGRRLSAEAFPVLPLAATGHDDFHTRLIADFHAWQAPWLLMLAQLDAGTRQMLEQQARQQALKMFDLHLLYPEVIDASGIKAALVEAVMQRSQSMFEKQGDEMLPTYYIEMNPGPTD